MKYRSVIVVVGGFLVTYGVLALYAVVDFTLYEFR